jgi:hypothetical protein
MIGFNYGIQIIWFMQTISIPIESYTTKLCRDFHINHALHNKIK